MAENRLLIVVATAVVLLSLAVSPLGVSYLGNFFPLAFLQAGTRVIEHMPSSLGATILPTSTPQPHSYRTEIISADPLVIYFHNFIAPSEIPSLLNTAEPLFRDSLVTGNNGQIRISRRRTSQSAILPIHDPVVETVLNRATEVIGGMLAVPYDDFQPPQLARYTAGQYFDVHADWFDIPQARRADSTGNGSTWNRQSSFFAILEDDCTGGETWFPHLKSPRQVDNLSPARNLTRIWREHEDGGLAFKPVKGGALFWVNLYANGTGDDRTRHAGLPVESGLKTGMNIWSRIYYP
ncbi:hypothetical protein BJ166DRAFT_591333 [Pestalotiopsis sp. NC0098]|nr:hypothetical protein BJ166DRAFT_591333 [Pestalotiopsis sp. NC0098]